MFTIPSSENIHILTGSYILTYLVLSVLVAWFASYTALSLNDRVQGNSFFHRNFWMTLASIAIGLGIWSMHFIGMQAYHLPVETAHYPFLTFLSMLPAIIASFIAFYLASRPDRSTKAILIASILMGCGIASMHYIGMAAMQTEAAYAYRPTVFIWSLLIAFLTSFVTIKALTVKRHVSRKRLFRVAVSLVIGLGIALMHYVGTGVVVYYVPVHLLQEETHSNSLLTIGLIIIGICLLLLLSILSSFLDRYVQKQLNLFDPLTKLPNRRQFEELKDSNQQPVFMAVLYIHQLETWNDMYGYHFGDKIIQTIGLQLHDVKQHTGKVYRVEGNQFIIVSYSQKQIPIIKNFLDRLSSDLRSSLLVNEQQIRLPTAIVFTEGTGSTVTQLYQQTQAVIHHRDTEFHSRVIAYKQDIHTQSFEQELLSDLQTAMDQDSLYMVYQPKIALNQEEINGFEALLRWKHPKHGELSPGMFIPIMEKHQKMEDMTDWIIQKVANEAATAHNPRPIAINIPGTYLASRRLRRVLRENIRQYDIDASLIELELTETNIVQNLHTAIEAIQKLREMGIRVALDDFGTGFSSLSYLKELPIHTLKVDKSFVDHVTDSDRDAAVLRTIISLSTDLDLDIVIEGVETAQQVDFLKTISDRLIIQGFYYTKPLTSEEIKAWCHNYESTSAS